MSPALRASLIINWLNPQLALWAIDIPSASRTATLNDLILFINHTPHLPLLPLRYKLEPEKPLFNSLAKEF
jgi:hypothetical protein